jgi:Leucine-rich repeat (LRR) protein
MATKKASTPKKSKKIEAPPGSPERVVRFFEEELADYEGRAAHGMEYFSSESKLTLRFSPQGAADVLETYGEDLPETPSMIPLAVAKGQDDVAFVVDPRAPELPVLFFEHEAGFHPFAPSFDAFLAGLLKKGEKTPLENLSKIYTKANALHEKNQHAKVVALLEPAIAQMPPTKPRSLDHIADSLPASHNLLGLAYKELGRIEEAVKELERAAELGSDMGTLNLCDVRLERGDFEGLAAMAGELAERSWKIGDAYEWFHARCYLGIATVRLGREADAERTYHAIWSAFRHTRPARLDEAATQLREHGGDAAVARRILAWLTKPAAPPSEAARTELRAWWDGLKKDLRAALTKAGKLGSDAPSDVELARLVTLDHLELKRLGLKDLSFLAPFRALDSLFLDENAFEDFSTLPPLPALRHLRAGEGKLKRLDGITNAPRLEALFVRENPLQTLDGVEALRELKKLDFAKAKVATLEPVRGLPLEEITAYENKIEDLSPLAECPSLKKISIFSNRLKHGLAALTSLRFLEEIDAIEWKIPEAEHRAFRRARPDVEIDIYLKPDPDAADPSATTDADRAWWSTLSPTWKRALADRRRGNDDESLGTMRAETDCVFLDAAGLDSLAPLTHLQRLDFVGCKKNALTDLSPLAELPRLRVVRAQHNRITDVKKLGALVDLVELDLAHNALTSLEGLQGCTSLRDLDVTGSPIEALDPIAKLHELRVLALGETRVRSLAPLAGLTRLRTLDLHGCPIDDLAPLAACVDLEELDVWSIPSPKGLDALTSLPRLRRITSHGALGEAAIETFRAKRPEVDLD